MTTALPHKISQGLAALALTLLLATPSSAVDTVNPETEGALVPKACEILIDPNRVEAAHPFLRFLYEHDVLKAALSLRYRVRLVGSELLDARDNTQTLILANHPAMIDPQLVMTTLRPWLTPSVIMKAEAATTPGIRQIVAVTDPIVIPTEVRNRADLELVVKGLEQASADLNAGKNILLYPSGQILRQRLEDLGNKSAVERIQKKVPGLKILLVRTVGLWGSGTSFGATGAAPDYARVLKDGFWTLLKNGIIFAPRRDVTITVEEIDPATLPSDPDELNRFLERFYNQDAPPARAVVKDWLAYVSNGFNRYIALPEPLVPGEYKKVPNDIRALVRKHLSQKGRVLIERTADAAPLRDLGFQGAKLSELALWIGSTFAVPIPAVETLVRVHDVLQTAVGEADPVTDTSP